MESLENIGKNFGLIGEIYVVQCKGYQAGYIAGNNAGQDQGVRIGVLAVLDCGRREFGSHYMLKLSNAVEKRHGDRLLGNA